MARPQRGFCAQCHQQRVLEYAYPMGLCDQCNAASLVPTQARLSLPRESIVTIREADVQVGFLTQAYVDVIDHDAEGWMTVRIKHWAKQPYRVTRAEGT